MAPAQLPISPASSHPWLFWPSSIQAGGFSQSPFAHVIFLPFRPDLLPNSKVRKIWKFTQTRRKNQRDDADRMMAVSAAHPPYLPLPDGWAETTTWPGPTPRSIPRGHDVSHGCNLWDLGGIDPLLLFPLWPFLDCSALVLQNFTILSEPYLSDTASRGIVANAPEPTAAAAKSTEN